ncbi:hypothetical protein [Sandarakinorhabdus sp.]|uniref:hypothetical protein n=1 Tax=Sandarakinorhabdus sp. TaxID=1916663 RepID=UPI00286E4435|nr:hypothetical protein [Sandarakinorhabdus sp.]
MRAILLCASAALVLAGCTANDNSIHRNILLPKARASVQSVDAKQRFLIAVPVTSTVEAEGPARTEPVKTSELVPGADGKPATSVTKEVISTHAGAKSTTTTSYRYCAEPSPDVFSVYANSAAANAGVEEGAAAGPLSVLFGFSGSSAEQGSTIARTQTINLLKEVMYRTCERYANGGIGPLELGVQAIRDQRLIIAALAIEQLTGAVVTKPTIIGAAGSAGTGADAAGAVVAIDKAFTEKVKADAALEKAQAKLTKADGEKKLCQPADKRPEGEEKPTEEQTKACEAAAGEVDKAKTAAAVAATRVNLLADAAKSGGPITAAMTNLLAVQGAGGIDTADTSHVKDVADVVQYIVKANYDASELELLCIKAFDPGGGRSPIGALVESCKLYFEARISEGTAKANANEDVFSAFAAASRNENRSTISRQDTIELLRRQRIDDFEKFEKSNIDQKNGRIERAKSASPSSALTIEKLKTADKNESFRIWGLLSRKIRQILSGEL